MVIVMLIDAHEERVESIVGADEGMAVEVVVVSDVCYGRVEWHSLA